MASVTSRISKIKQPWGGFLSIKEFQSFKLNDSLAMWDDENINAGLIGSSVDYLTRFMLGVKVEESFKISFYGALNSHRLDEAKGLMHSIDGLNSKSVIAAVKLTTFDVWYRNYGKIEDPDVYRRIQPNSHTIANIILMVQRNLKILKKYAPVLKVGFEFSGSQTIVDASGSKKKVSCSGYSSVVTKGDGDVLTKDILWDLKTNSKEPESKDTLQLLMYYIMGKHSGLDQFKNIDKIAIYNARLDKFYLCCVSRINPEIISTIERDVICY